MRFNGGVDLHGNNNFGGIIDRKGKRIEQKKLPDNLFVILGFLKPYKKDIVGIEGLEMFLHAPVIIGRLWVPGTVNGGKKSGNGRRSLGGL